MTFFRRLQPDWKSTCEKPKEDDTERIDIGQSADIFAVEILWIGMAQGDRTHTCLRQGRVGGERVEQLQRAKVKQFYLAAFRHKDVCRFQIAMQHRVAMHERNCAADLHHQTGFVFDRRRRVVADIVDAAAIDVLHGEVGAPSSVMPPSSSLAILRCSRRASVSRFRRNCSRVGPERRVRHTSLMVTVCLNPPAMRRARETAATPPRPRRRSHWKGPTRLPIHESYDEPGVTTARVSSSAWGLGCGVARSSETEVSELSKESNSSSVAASLPHHSRAWAARLFAGCSPRW